MLTKAHTLAKAGAEPESSAVDRSLRSNLTKHRVLLSGCLPKGNNHLLLLLPQVPNTCKVCRNMWTLLKMSIGLSPVAHEEDFFWFIFSLCKWTTEAVKIPVKKCKLCLQGNFWLIDHITLSF